jgi:FkbM family methyltransferase
VNQARVGRLDHRAFDVLSGFPKVRGRNLAAIAYGLIRRPNQVLLGGVKVVVDPQWATVRHRALLYDRSYESVEREILDHTLLSSDRYMELGAGTGYMTTAASRIVSSDKAVSYEANPQMIEIAEQTFKLNGVTPTLINAVLGDGDGTTDFYLHQYFSESTTAPTDGLTRISVPKASFKEALAAHLPSYLMVDIEGAEIHLLANGLPAHVRSLCVDTHPGVVGEQAIHGMLSTLIDDGFVLDDGRSRDNILFLQRRGPADE